MKKHLTTHFKKVFWFLLRISIAILIIGWLIQQNKNDLVRIFRQLDYKWIGLAFVLYCSHLFIAVWRWQVLLKIQKISISFIETLSLLMQGFFFSLVIPGGALGGDLVKAGMIASRSKKGNRLEGMFTIIIDRIIGMVGLFSLLLLVSLFSISDIQKLDGLVKIAVYAIIAASFVGLGATVILMFHRQIEKIKLFAWLINIFDTYSNGTFARLSNALDLYKKFHKTLFLLVVISVIGIHMNILCVSYCVALGVAGTGISFHNVLLGSIFGITASILPITPSGVGTRDTVMKEIFCTGGLSGGVATAIPLIFTSIILLFNLAGGLFFIFQTRNKVDPDLVNNSTL